MYFPAMPYTTKIGLFAYFFNVNSSDPLPQGNHDNIHTSTHMDTQPTVASQPILRTTNAQVSNAINMAGGNAVVQPKKHRMTKDERLVHDAIRGFYKRIAQVGSFLGTACVFHTLCFTIQYGSLFFYNQSAKYVHSLQIKPVATSLDSWTLPSFEKEHGSLVEDFLCAIVHQAPSVSRPKVRGLLREHFKYKRYLKDLFGTC